MSQFSFAKLTWKELFLRKGRLVSGLLTITVGIGVIIAIQSIAAVSKREVAEKLDRLGANILVLPQGASTTDYYAADVDAPTVPETYVDDITTSMLPGVDNLSPKLSRSIDIGERKFILTGILPASELASKPIWQTSDLATIELQTACGTGDSAGDADASVESDAAGNRAVREVINSLGDNEIWLGSAVAENLPAHVGTTLPIKGKSFTVTHVLPETGTIEDDRIFAHLHTVQTLLGTGSQISSIEIMGCCSAISDGLLSKLRNILPDTRITTISHIVNTQIETNKLMTNISLILLAVIILVGGFSIGNYMWANVEERRKEIGIFITVGFQRRQLYRLFLLKSTVLGVAGGSLGFILGTGLGMTLAPLFSDLVIEPVPVYLLWSLLIALVITTAGSLYPIYKAVRIDPALMMQEQ